MPGRRKLAESVTQAGKQAMASGTAQIVVGTIADKVQGVAKEKAEDVSQTIRERAAKAAGPEPHFRPPSAPTLDTEAWLVRNPAKRS